MIGLKNYRYPALVASGILLSVAMINFALLVCAGSAPAWLVPSQTPIAWTALEQNQARISALYRECSARSGGPCKPLLIYVGLSTAREGIDPQVLRAHGGISLKPFGICGSGGSMQDMLLVTDPFFRTGIKPDVVVLCVHPAWMVGRPIESRPISLNPVPALLRGELREAEGVVASWNWFSSNRIYVQHVVQKIYYRVRLAVGAVEKDCDPWSPPERLGYPAKQDEASLRAQMAGFEGYGWFDPRQYHLQEDRQSAALAETISRFQALGSQVEIVLMPEHSRLRSRFPPQSRQSLMKTLRQCFPDAEPPLFDFAASVPDEMFSDYCHLNDTGRAEFTRLLARTINDGIATRPNPK